MDGNTQLSVDELEDLKVFLHFHIKRMDVGSQEISRAIEDYLKVTKLEHEFIKEVEDRKRDDAKAKSDKKMKKFEFAIQIGGIVYPITLATILHFIDMHWEETKDLWQPSARALSKFIRSFWKIKWF